MTRVSLYWPDYRLLPYERELAVQEAVALLRPRETEQCDAAFHLDATRVKRLAALTFFKAYKRGDETVPTLQAVIERNGTPVRKQVRRQSTRYSVHGLHEYKGKFNPQIARVILNAADLKRGSFVLDPFCGSGTTLVEAVHLGLSPIGADLNPLATFIANAKLDALAMDADEIGAVATLPRHDWNDNDKDAERRKYLEKWFSRDALDAFESIRATLIQVSSAQRNVGLAVASNLLREFSLQEPADLRIRRRTSPPSGRDPLDAFRRDITTAAQKVQRLRATLNLSKLRTRVLNVDARSLSKLPELTDLRGKIKLSITSPPYAMALPYIDTQRLSLVWLGLIRPVELASLQAELIGSREFTGARADWRERLNRNSAVLPRDAWGFCRKLAQNIGETDGFRRKAVPQLMYRYLSGMRDTFAAVGDLLAPGARFHVIVGHNHTTLDGKRIDINTPALLASIAENTPLRLERRHELQTYQRYALHQKNSVNHEELLIFRKA